MFSLQSHLTFKDGVLAIPTVFQNISSEYPNLPKQIHGLFSLTNGDILLVVSAKDQWRALEGALAAAKILA